MTKGQMGAAACAVIASIIFIARIMFKLPALTWFAVVFLVIAAIMWFIDEVKGGPRQERRDWDKRMGGRNAHLSSMPPRMSDSEWSVRANQPTGLYNYPLLTPSDPEPNAPTDPESR